MPYRLGVDVGGTFTDLTLIDDERATMHRVKVPSTPADPSRGVLAGIERIRREAGIAPSDIRAVMHGTTVATNAVLEGKGARVGLVTTRGFREILHLARSQTPGPLAGWIIMIKPDPPAALADTREAHERIDARGEVALDSRRCQARPIARTCATSRAWARDLSSPSCHPEPRRGIYPADLATTIQRAADAPRPAPGVGLWGAARVAPGWPGWGDPSTRLGMTRGAGQLRTRRADRRQPRPRQATELSATLSRLPAGLSSVSACQPSA